MIDASWRNRATGAVAAFAILGVAFLGGVEVQKHHTDAATSGAVPTFQRPTAFPSASTAVELTTGTITFVDGTTIYVKLADGSVVTVATTSDTAVTTAASGSVGALTKGQKVTVTGSTGSTGTFTATSVTGAS